MNFDIDVAWVVVIVAFSVGTLIGAIAMAVFFIPAIVKLIKLRMRPRAILDSAELLLQAKNYSGSGDWLDESGHGHHAQLGAAHGRTQDDR